MRTGMTARAATACPGGAGLRCCRHGHVLPGQDRPTLRPRPAVSGRPVWPGSRHAVIALALPSQSAPAHCLWVSVFPTLSTTNYYEINIRSMFGPIYRELQRGMWTNLSFLSMHTVCITISQVGVPLWARPGNGIPSISTGCAQPRDRYAQGIHMLCTQSLLLRSGLPDLWPADPAVQALLLRRRGTPSCGEYTEAWRRLADVAAATQPKRGSDDPKVSDSIRTNGPYLTSEGSRSGYQPL